jgi:hypothetical protein
MAQVTLGKFFSGVPQIRESDGDSKKIYEHKRNPTEKFPEGNFSDLSINVPYHRLTMTIGCLNFYSGNLSRFQYFDRKGNTHQGQFSKIRTPQITLAFHWPAKINKMLIHGIKIQTTYSHCQSMIRNIYT